jgi:hypothetical protein
VWNFLKQTQKYNTRLVACNMHRVANFMTYYNWSKDVQTSYIHSLLILNLICAVCGGSWALGWGHKLPYRVQIIREYKVKDSRHRITKHAQVTYTHYVLWISFDMINMLCSAPRATSQLILRVMCHAWNKCQIYCRTRYPFTLTCV